MTTPVAPAAARPGPPGRADGPGRRAGAEPFASALDGALADRRPPADTDRVGPDAAREKAATSTAAPTESAEGQATAAEEPAAGTTPTVPPVWALALGQTAGGPAGGGAATADGVPPGTGVPPVAAPPPEAGVPAPGSPVAAGTDHVPGTAPGQAVAGARTQGLAVGLLDGVPPGTAGAPAPGAGEGRGHGSGPAAGALPVTAAAAAQAQAQLRAALDATTGGTGVAPPDVVVDPAGPGGGPAAPAAVPPPAPAAPQPATVAASGGTLPVAAPGATQSGGAGAEPDASDGGTGQQTAGVPAPAALTSVAPSAQADADGATGPATATPVSAQLARQVAVLRGAPDGSHTMTLVLTPETLGPVEVSVTVTRGTVDLVLRGAHEHGRAALQDALPDLRRDLEAAGLTTSRVEVARDGGGGWLDRHAGQQAQQGFGDRPGQQGSPEGRSRPWLRPADSGETRTVPSTGSTSSGVDVRV